MQIQRINNQDINFKRIQLNQANERLVTNLLKDLSSKKTSNIDKIKMDLFEIFDPFFQDVLSKYSKLYTHKDDFLQGIYLRFFETLDKVREKTLSTMDFLPELNKIIKPNENEKKEREFSLDKPIKDISIPFRENLTEDYLPIYASQKNNKEREVFEKELKKISKDIELSENEKKVFDLKKQGKNFKEISGEIKKSYTRARLFFLSSIAKIQKQNNILPIKYNDFAQNFKKEFSIDLQIERIINILIKLPENYSLNWELVKTNIKETSKILKISETDFAKAVLRQPQLFYRKPETIKQNVFEAIQAFNISEEDYIKAGLKQPHLFYWKPETLKQNVVESSKILNIPNTLYIETALSHPQLFYQKPETLKQNLAMSAKLFGISEDLYIRAALIHPQLFYQKPKTLKQNLANTAKSFQIEEQDFLKIALKHPTLLTQKPETLKKNIQESAKTLGIKENLFLKAALNKTSLFQIKPEFLKQNAIKFTKLLNLTEAEFIKIALRQPALFYQKPETIKENIINTSRLLGISETEFIKVALRLPQLFYQKPETLKQNISKTAKIFNVSEQEFINEALKNVSFFCLKPESSEKKLNKYIFYKKISGKFLENFSSIIRNKADEFFERSLFFFIKKELKDITKKDIIYAIKNNPNKIFSFDLPQDECTEDFIQYVKTFFAKNIGTTNYKFLVDGK